VPRRRPLRPEELDLWQQVVRTALPIDPDPQDRPKRSEAGLDDGPQTLPAQPPRPLAPPPPLPLFRLGDKVRTVTRHDLVPPLSERLAAAPLRMDAKAFARMSRGRLAPEARIDLHGMTLSEARSGLVPFILEAQAKGRRLVLVITGKGRSGRDDGPLPQRPGALKQQVPVWLRQEPLARAVLQVAEAHPRHGGAGAYYVYLSRPR
jgi:DNA-nicking Smr family endonuclease